MCCMFVMFIIRFGMFFVLAIGVIFVVFFKQKTAYEMRISDWSSDVCSSDLDMAVDWLAAGVSPSSATLFIQSQVPEHAELHLLLSMICPLGWLERVPSYKELQQNLQHKDLDTYGFLGYPLLQAADILIYRAGLVPVGADQLPHIEFARDVARRFNHLYGREADFEDKAEAAIRKLGKK